MNVAKYADIGIFWALDNAFALIKSGRERIQSDVGVWRYSTAYIGDLQATRKRAIANALQLEAARRRAGPIPFNTSPVASLKSLSLSVAVLERIYC